MADVLVSIGAGGMGEAIVRRTGSGRRVLLSDFNEDLLSDSARSDAGQRVRRRNPARAG